MREQSPASNSPDDSGSIVAISSVLGCHLATTAVPETKSSRGLGTLKVLQDASAVGERLKELFIEVSPFIELYTGRVCPRCTQVCCTQRHAFADERDLIFMHALGIDAELPDSERPLEGACQWLGPAGCEKPRWMRPFRCTWFFCEPLLRVMEDGPQRGYRRLIGMMGEMVRLYSELPSSSTETTS